jgi:hypothetical protein
MSETAEKVRTIGPHSRPHTLAKLDQRTRAARHLRETVAELTAHVGSPSVVQRMLIQRAAVLSLKLLQLDAEPVLSEHDMRAYSCWQNHLRLVLREIGIHPAAERPPSLREYWAQVVADREEHAAIAAPTAVADTAKEAP